MLTDQPLLTNSLPLATIAIEAHTVTWATNQLGYRSFCDRPSRRQTTGLRWTNGRQTKGNAEEIAQATTAKHYRVSGRHEDLEYCK